MESNEKRLNVDFIESKPLKKEEEKALSEYIKHVKDKKSQPRRKAS